VPKLPKVEESKLKVKKTNLTNLSTTYSSDQKKQTATKTEQDDLENFLKGIDDYPEESKSNNSSSLSSKSKPGPVYYNEKVIPQK